MIKKILYILYIIGLCFPGLLCAQINTDRVMTIGKNALYFEDYVLSIQYFNQVINAKSYLAEPFFYRGLAKMNLDDYQGAEADCSEALERNPFVVNAYQVRGISRIRQGKYRDAISDYERALELDPENISLWHNLALCRMHEKEYGAAQADLDTLIRIAPRYTDAYLMRTEVSLKQKDTLQAMTDADKAIGMDRYNPDTWASRGMLFLQRRKYADAESDLTEAIRLSVRNAGLYINRALARYHQNNLRGAMSDYDLALDVEPGNFIGHYNRGLLRAQVGDDNRAIEDFDFVLKVEPDNMMATFNRALLRDRTGDYTGAEADYTAVLGEYPNFLLGYQYRAGVRRKMGDLKGADADEFKVLKAQLEAQNGQRKKSQKPAGKDDEKTRKQSDRNVENFRKIMVADNDDEQSRYKTDYRGRVQDRNVNILPQPMFALTYYERPEEVRRQINYYKAIDDLNSRHVLPQPLLITNVETSLSEDMVKQHFASIDEQTAAIVKEPRNALHYYARALDFYLVQDFDNALSDLDEAVRCDSTFMPAYFSRALIYYKQLEYRKRDKNYEVEMKLEKQYQVHAYDYNKVKEDLDKVIRLAPDFVYAYFNRGNILTAMKDYRGALVDYSKAIELDSRFADAYFNRGLTNIFLGNNTQGIRDLSKAGELGIFSAYNIIKRFTAVSEK